jgi:S-adenosylmethionine:tRNA ribosyltransferase-isomerase
MNVSEFDFELPRELIAQEAVEPRDAARLLVLDRAPDVSPTEHRVVRDLPRLLAPGDLLVVNDTRVVPARIHGRKASGGRVEVLLLEPDAAGTWRALVGASRSPRRGDRLTLPAGFRAEVVASADDEGVARLRLDGPGDAAALMDAAGVLPLPPYIKRAPEDERHRVDRQRYQTIFAREPGALAAPTASLHFTPRLIDELGASGIELAALTLHVGEGTFRTPEADRLDDISLHAERYRVPEVLAARIAATRARGGRVVAVGTTVVRALESRPLAAPGVPEPGSETTTLFIRPGHEFRVVDALMTNFHLPRSTLIMLVAAFAGRERVLAAYRDAVERRYRFFSYGDAMLVVGAARSRPE